MIEIIPSLLTPAVLAMSPPAQPAAKIEYNWHTQTASISGIGKSAYAGTGSMRGTQSFVPGNNVTTIDDWQAD